MSGWHLDRKVPLGIILAIAVQTVIIGMFIGSLSTRVDQLERAANMRIDERDRLIVLETQMRAIHETLVRIERRLEQPASSQR